ncbi:MAG: FG-GAP-like repeat-containing protein [Limisphaerales bacterium]
METTQSGFSIDKRLIIGLLLTLGVALSFWTGSRYPDLNEKSSIGGDRDLQGIAFDVVLEVKADDPAWKRVIFSTVNWMETNKKGMAFGLVFAACLLTILGFMEGGPIQGLMGNTFKGFLIGVPLGLCVNCAAPVAYGLNKGGSKPETALGAMLSSPTMNVIVVGMMFSLLPWYLAALKLVSSLILIFLVIPLVVKLAPKQWLTANVQAAESCDINTVCEFTPPDTVPANWGEAATWTGKNFIKNLLRIAKQTVPLMLLAGFLGSLLITLLPFELMESIASSASRYSPILIMVALALVGVVLPVPMAFDIVVVIILIGLGIPESFAAVLLLTLGSYSIYSYLIVAKAFSHRLAVCLSFAVVIIALKRLDSMIVSQLLYRHFNGSKPVERKVPLVAAPTPWPVIQSELSASPLALEAFTAFTNQTPSSNHIFMASYAYPERESASGKLFERRDGEDLGIDLPTMFSIRKFVIYPQIFARGLASGDVHGDNYPDLLIPGDPDIGGLYLFANVRGERFVRQELDLGKFNQIGILNAALVDLNNDHRLDIVFTTLDHGNYTVLNSGGRFHPQYLQQISHKPGATCLSMGFSDFDRDGMLDMYAGNYTVGHVAEMVPISHESSRNQVIFNRAQGRFEPRDMPDLPGETLGVMIADINNDRYDDLVCYNDWAVSDMFYVGTPRGPQRVLPEDGLIDQTCWGTMSMRFVDVDNDLRPEIYISQVSDTAQINGDKNIAINMKEFERLARTERERELRQQFRNNMQIFRAQSHLAWLHFIDEDIKQDWIAYRVVRSAAMALSPGYENHSAYQQESVVKVARNDDAQKVDFREYTPDHRKDVLMFLDRIESPHQAIVDQDMPGEIPQNRDYKNLLLKRRADGRYVNLRNSRGLAAAGWTWNANFADVDHDEYQDAYVANGFTLLPSRQNNTFFHSDHGTNFTLLSDEFGLSDYSSTSAYNFIDFDRDGDLDIVTLPVAIANARVFQNQGPKGNSITIQLRDDIGNSYAIGAQIVIRYGDGKKQQIRHIQASGGFMSFDPLEAHFGIGEHEQVERIEVFWPNRAITRLSGPFRANHCYRVHRKPPAPKSPPVNPRRIF